MILDTNALSAFIEGDVGVGAILRKQDRVTIPVIVLGEYRYGIARSRYRNRYEGWLEANLHDFNVLAITTETTLPYAKLRVTLKESGHPIPANDTWIAALAMQHGLPILSRDVHFDAVADVVRVAW